MLTTPTWTSLRCLHKRRRPDIKQITPIGITQIDLHSFVMDLKKKNWNLWGDKVGALTWRGYARAHVTYLSMLGTHRRTSSSESHKGQDVGIGHSILKFTRPPWSMGFYYTIVWASVETGLSFYSLCPHGNRLDEINVFSIFLSGVRSLCFTNSPY